MRAYFDINNNRYWIVISEFNTKMGPVPSFSTPSVVTCPKGLPCYGACYARAYEEKRDTVHLSYCNNLKMLLEFPDIVRDKIVAYINLNTPPYFRFSVSGDVEVDPLRPFLYINLIISVAKKCPKTKILVFTKSSLWNEVKTLPRNLKVVYSNWKDWKVDNPVKKNGEPRFPTVNIMDKKEDKGDRIICPNSINKSHHCINCHKCWDMKSTETIFFYTHGIYKNKA